MLKTLDPFRLLLISVAGWMNHVGHLLMLMHRSPPKDFNSL